MEKIKSYLAEIVIFLSIVFILSIGTYSRNRLWNNPVDLWKDCVKKSSHKARPYVNLGFAYLESGQYDKALETTQKGIDLDPKFAGAYYNLGIIYQKIGDLDKAIAMGKKSREIDPELHMAEFLLGSIYFENGRLEEAAETYSTFLKSFPYFPGVHQILGIIYAGQKQFDKAIAEFEWEIRINPYNSLAHLNLGQIYWYEFQNRQKAIRHLKIALMLDPLLPKRGEIRKLVQLLEGLP
ncbi:MAG TPA: tetratricopeptide repeat protein [Thermodesulfobacteriota bacterium]|nr:tetratricopeptide repeat protein [Thermodesulfobacteriota bacterium]